MTALEDLMRNFYKDGTKELHWGKVGSSIVVLVALIVFIFYNNSRLQYKSNDRLANRRYTIGTTGARHHGIRSSQPTVKFYYMVLGKEYQGNQDIDAQYEKTVVANGGRYFVEFSSKDPNNSKLLLGEPIPTSIQSAPDSGWANIIRE